MIEKRKGKEYLEWRESVFERDNYTCTECETKGKKLHAHHIVRWEDDKSLRININNGITLCTSCHNKHHHIGRIPWNRGKVMSDEQKKKLSDAKKGRPSNNAGKTGQKSWNKGIKTGIGGPKGQKFSDEHKAKLSAAKKGKPSWNVGIPMKEETKDIFRKRIKGKTWIIDPETSKRKWID